MKPTTGEYRQRRYLDPQCQCDPWNYDAHTDPGCPLTTPPQPGRRTLDLLEGEPLDTELLVSWPAWLYALGFFVAGVMVSWSVWVLVGR